MSKKQKMDVERPYVVDGIKEYDNPLPSWWVTLFWATIAFAFVYLAYVHFAGGPTLLGELSEDRQEYERLVAEAEKVASSQDSGLSPAELEKAIASGKEIYTANCGPCHGAEGQGVIGPNLTDAYWLHGGSLDDIKRSISEGIPAKGMVAWKSILGLKKIGHLAVFIQSIQGTTPANAKAAQGELYKPEQASMSISDEEKQEAIKVGQEVYTANCAPCHGGSGQGVIGPNLTDAYWLHGGSLQDITKSIAEGIPEKGMVAWKRVLGGKKVKQLAIYIQSIQGTNPENPKAPQGELYEQK